MQKMILLFVIMTPFLLQSALFADKAYILKNKIILSTNIIALQQLFNNECGTSFPVFFEKSRFYTNEELSRTISKGGLKNFILIGDGIRVDVVKRFSTPEEIAERIDIPAPVKQDIIRYFSINPLPVKFAVKEAVSFHEGQNLVLRLSGYTFTDIIGSETNFSLSIPLSSEPVRAITQRDSTGETTESMTLQNIYRSTADMVYRKGPITIITKVKIRRKLEDNSYLVENYNSGRIMKVRVLDHTEFNQNQGL